MNNIIQYWRDVAKRLQEEHPDKKPPADWTRKEAKPFFEKLLEETGFTVSYATFRRVFKENAEGKEETKDIFAKYFGYESHRDFIAQNTQQKKRKRFFLIPYLLVSAAILFFVVTLVCNGFTSQNKDTSYSDTEAVIQIVKDAVQAEFSTYQSIPNYHKNLDSLKSFFLSDGAAYKNVLKVVQGQTAHKWIISNEGNQSTVNIQDPVVDSITNKQAYVSTREHWTLEWYNEKAHRYEYIYDVINRQQYILTKEPETKKWKIASNKYNDTITREIPQAINCAKLLDATQSHTNMQQSVQAVTASGNVHLAVRIIDCYYQRHEIQPSLEFILLTSEKNDLYRDLNTEKIDYASFKIQKKRFALEVLEYANSLVNITSLIPSSTTEQGLKERLQVSAEEE